MYSPQKLKQFEFDSQSEYLLENQST